MKFEKEWDAFCASKTLDPDKLEQKVTELRALGKTIATINGSFDLLHSGHLYILYEAAKQAECLIVAVNSDASIKAYKGENRPVIPLKGRMDMLLSLAFVDFVTWFEETDPCLLLEKIKPNVHVNGAEYGPHCIESSTVKKYGGRIVLVPRIGKALSTSSLIQRLQV